MNKIHEIIDTIPELILLTKEQRRFIIETTKPQIIFYKWKIEKRVDFILKEGNQYEIKYLSAIHDLQDYKDEKKNNILNSLENSKEKGEELSKLWENNYFEKNLKNIIWMFSNLEEFENYLNVKENRNLIRFTEPKELINLLRTTTLFNK